MGVDLAQFELETAPREECSTDAPTIGYLGTLGAERQLVVLIDMLDELRKTFGIHANLLLVGEGNRPADRQILQRRAAELDLTPFVKVTGFLPRERALEELRAATVCISPFYPTPILLSTSPTKLIEYMALAMPVVANDHPEQSLTIEQSGAGFCVPWGASAFAQGVARILQMPEKEREVLGQRGRKWVEKNRTYAKIADDLERQYRSLLR
jgi:glycosyltransferase involved in cell wall biosynthesis